MPWRCQSLLPRLLLFVFCREYSENDFVILSNRGGEVLKIIPKDPLRGVKMLVCCRPILPSLQYARAPWCRMHAIQILFHLLILSLPLSLPLFLPPSLSFPFSFSLPPKWGSHVFSLCTSGFHPCPLANSRCLFSQWMNEWMNSSINFLPSPSGPEILFYWIKRIWYMKAPSGKDVGPQRRHSVDCWDAMELLRRCYWIHWGRIGTNLWQPLPAVPSGRISKLPIVLCLLSCK